MDQNQDRRRGHFHRGRRGSDRSGLDRRSQPPPQERPGRDEVNVEQIMREIRARVAQRQGVDLTGEQIQDLAARRLEAILDPRAMKSSFMEELRRTAGAVVPTMAPKAATEPVYTFDDTTIYDSHRAILRFIRTLLNPLLKLFFNPNPLIRALHLQGRLNVEAAEREAERDRRQVEWNALHYEIVQRLVTEISRLSLEVQALSTRVESLNARVDFNDRRVRGVEGTMHQLRPAGRPPAEAAPAPKAPEISASPEGAAEPPQGDSARRRRRRRRGRRGTALPGEATLPGAAAALPSSPAGSTEPEPVVETQEEATATHADVPAALAESEALAEYERREAAPVHVPEPPAEPQATPSEPASEVDLPDTDRSEQ